MEWVLILLYLMVGGAFLIWWAFLSKPSNFPPGPSGIQTISAMMKFVKAYETCTLPEFLKSMHGQYGPLVGLRAGAQTFVFLEGRELITKVYNSDAFAHRPVVTMPAVNKLNHGKPLGLFNNNGPAHMEMRRFALINLKDLGVGRKTIDERIQTEASIICQHLDELSLTPDRVVPNFRRSAQLAIANILHNIIFGFRYEHDDPAWQTLGEKLYGFFSVNFLAFPENTIPILGKIPALHHYLCNNEDVKFFALNDYLEKYAKKQVEEHRATYCEDDIRDFTDLYVKYENEHKEYYTTENMLLTILDLFRAGSDTTATLLTWCVLYITKYPAIQAQLQEEVDRVFGDKMFDRELRGQLIKLQAFICEVHRYVTIAVPSPPRCPVTTTELCGYTIPENTTVLANIYGVHHDQEYWGDPHNFRIERWIDENGKLISHSDYFIPFSVGKRVCPGKQLAEIEIMIFLVEILQKFSFEKADDTVLSEDPLPGLVKAPKPFHFKINRR